MRCRPVVATATATARALGRCCACSGPGRRRLAQQRRWVHSETQQTSGSSSNGVSETASAAADAAPMVVFSGIQPTGVPHLGNYLGALRQWVQLQEELVPRVDTGATDGKKRKGKNKLFFSVVDLHAITVGPRPDHPVLRQRRREMLAALLAVGLDPERSVLFYQSSVPAHSELMWILSCTASVGYLSRMTQWKSKLNLSEEASVTDEKARAALKLGLFSYPVLQAADILVHGATHVPVGDDQRQHLEFARECAVNFNHAYGSGKKGPLLVPPETILAPTRRVMSLQQPTQKMSKSHADARSRVLLTDTADQIRAKIMAARTDAAGHLVSYEPASRPGVANLLDMLAFFSEASEASSPLSSSTAQPPTSASEATKKTPEALAADLAAGGATLRDLKAATAEAVARGLAGVRERYLDALEGRLVDEVEAAGAKAARANAARTMTRVREAMGM